MPGQPRSEVIDRDSVSLYHCFARSVRQFLLLGRVPDGAGHVVDRRRWIEGLQRKLASLFAIELAFSAILMNHLHLILRIRPDIVTTWSDEEVVRRWLIIAKIKRLGRVDVPPPSPFRIQQELAKPKRVAQLRKRLADPSWWMGTLCESVSRRINQTEKRKGTCWEGRFGCRRLVDEVGLLLCGIYVDLNVIRAGLAQTPEESRYTSAYDRIRSRRLQDDHQQKIARQIKNNPPAAISASSSAGFPSIPWPDSHLVPIYLDESQPANCEACQRSATSYRASDKGLLPMTLDQYLELLDATGRMIVEGKQGSIPDHLAPILQRLEICPSQWVTAVERFPLWFGSLVGHVDQLTAAAERAGRRWVRGKSRCASLFAPG